MKQNQINILWITIIIIILVISSGFVIRNKQSQNQPKKSQETNKIIGQTSLVPEDKIVTIDNNEDNYDRTFIFKRSQEIIDGKTFKTISGWVNPQKIDLEPDKNKITFDVFPYDGGIRCGLMELTVNGLANNTFVKNNDKIEQITPNDIKTLSNNKLIATKIFYETEKISFWNKIWNYLKINNAHARCYWFETIKAEKIYFSIPNAQNEQTIKVDKLYVDREIPVMIAFPQINQGLNLYLAKFEEKYKPLISQRPFLIAVNRGAESYLQFNNGQTIYSANTPPSHYYNYLAVPFNLFKNYEITGNFLCSEFDNPCIFNITKFGTNINADLNNNQVNVPFEYTFDWVDKAEKINDSTSDYCQDYNNFIVISNEISDQDTGAPDKIVIDVSKYLNAYPDLVNGTINGRLYLRGELQCNLKNVNNIQDWVCVVKPTTLTINND